MERTYLTPNPRIDLAELVDLDAFVEAVSHEAFHGPFHYTNRVVNEIAAVAAALPLFEGIEYAQLRAIAAHMQHVHLAEGCYLFSEGDESDYMCFIVSGRVELLKQSQGGKLVLMSTLAPGDTIGEMALIDSYPRLATVIAAAPTTMLMLKREHFDHILDEDAKAGVAFLRALAQDYRGHNA